MRGKTIRPAAVKRRTRGYIRISTEDQAREGVSIETQRARISAMAIATGRELYETVSDAGVSAGRWAERGYLTAYPAFMRRSLSRSTRAAASEVLAMYWEDIDLRKGQ